MMNRRNLLTVFSMLVLVAALSSCSSELLDNGDFCTGSLEPWTLCTLPMSGGVGSSMNTPCFYCGYNLRLTGSDCVQQFITPVALPAESLKFGYACPDLHMESGTFTVKVFYTNGSVDTFTMERKTECGPRTEIPLDGIRSVNRVQFSVAGAVASWYVERVSLRWAQ
jgi:hypothetical protein